MTAERENGGPAMVTISRGELMFLVCQYRDDLRWPPDEDGKQRRIAALNDMAERYLAAQRKT